MSNNLSEENQQLLEEKIARLEKALILETRADERLRLEHEIKELHSQKATNHITILEQIKYLYENGLITVRVAEKMQMKILEKSLF